MALIRLLLFGVGSEKLLPVAWLVGIRINLQEINILVQAAGNIARGYRTVEYFMTVIYLIAGRLNFHLPA